MDSNSILCTRFVTHYVFELFIIVTSLVSTITLVYVLAIDRGTRDQRYINIIVNSTEPLVNAVKEMHSKQGSTLLLLQLLYGATACAWGLWGVHTWPETYAKKNSKSNNVLTGIIIKPPSLQNPSYDNQN